MKKSRWISAKMFPEIDKLVLICEADYKGEPYIFTVGWYGKKYPDSKEENTWNVLPNCDGYEWEPAEINPVFWMELPEPPSKERMKNEKV